MKPFFPFKTTEYGNEINLIKHDLVQGCYSKADVAHKISKYNPPENRIRQLKDIYIKYKKALDLELFKYKMHQKLGVKLIFHKDKNGSVKLTYCRN